MVDGFVKPKRVGAFIVIFNVNFNILKQFERALVWQIKDLITFLWISKIDHHFHKRKPLDIILSQIYPFDFLPT